MRSLLLGLTLCSVFGSGAHAGAPTGSVKGVVQLEGKSPDRPKQERDVDPKCSQGKLDDALIVTNGKVRDAFVRIKPGTMGAHDERTGPVVLDQSDCTYSPHVFALSAGQQITVKNSDSTFHNVHGKLLGKSLWNKMQGPKDPDLTFDQGAAKPGDVIEIQCNVHPWMHAYGVVMDHPFYAITKDDGSFEIKGLAEGEYTVESWHPVLGMKSVTIKIGKGKRGNVTARFLYKAEDIHQ
jgi:plastocyanin